MRLGVGGGRMKRSRGQREHNHRLRLMRCLFVGGGTSEGDLPPGIHWEKQSGGLHSSNRSKDESDGM